MSFSVGIVGLPNVGKSTLFKALTKKAIDIAPYPFTTINPNIGIVPVPDERLEKIAKTVNPEKITPTTIKFVDIAGLIKGAHKGEGLGNQFLAHIKECDAILEVIRTFSISEKEMSSLENQESQTIQYQIWEKPDPKRDIEIIKTELIMKDLETTEKIIQKLEKDAKSGNKETIKKFNILKEIKEDLSRGKKFLEFKNLEEIYSEVKEFQFLTLKPTIYVFNVSKNQKYSLELAKNIPSAPAFDIKLEEELSELTEKDRQELNLKPEIDSLIIACYTILDLITFYTIAGLKEVRAWTIKKGGKCPAAGGIVHSDFQEKFVRAEVISWRELVETGDWTKAKEKGLIRTEGKDYVVQEGDVIEFKI